MSFKIGVVGSIGTGKSLVSKIMSEISNAPIVSLDRIIKQLTKINNTSYDNIVYSFGNDILLKNKNLNIRKLREMIFNSPTCRDELNNDLFSSAIFELYAQLKEYEEDDYYYVIYDAPLLYESEVSQLMDYTIMINAPYQMRVKRIQEQNSITREEAIILIEDQVPADELMKYGANKIINNMGGIKYLYDVCNKIWEEIKLIS